MSVHVCDEGVSDTYWILSYNSVSCIMSGYHHIYIQFYQLEFDLAVYHLCIINTMLSTYILCVVCLGRFD